MRSLFFLGVLQCWSRKANARIRSSKKARLVVVCLFSVMVIFFVASARASESVRPSVVYNAGFGEVSAEVKSDSNSSLAEMRSYDKLEWIESGFEWAGWKAGEGTAFNQKQAVVSEFSSAQASEQQYLLSFVPNGSPLKKSHAVSSEFGGRVHPIQKKLRLHKGVDFGVVSGTPVHATANGTVVLAADTGNSGYGKYVVIRHGLGFSSLYAHLLDTSVQVGAHVSKGELLGRTGNSGSSTGPHLHYEVKYLGQVLDPESFLAWSGDNYASIFAAEKNVPWHNLRKQYAPLLQVAGLPFFPSKNY